MNERYSRQILFSGIGDEGQRRLLSARVLIVGCGALGSAHAEALARAGVGRLRIVEMMWQLVFADGRVSEFEESVIWRAADLLGISSRDRVELRQRVAAANPPAR